MTFSAAISLLTPLLFGLLARAARPPARDLVSRPEGRGRRAVSGVARRASAAAASSWSGQLSVALSLLLVAGLAVRMAMAFQQLDLGFDSPRPLDLEGRAARGALRLATTRCGPSTSSSRSGCAAMPGRRRRRRGRGASRARRRCPPRRWPSRAREPASEEAQPWAARTTVEPRLLRDACASPSRRAGPSATRTCRAPSRWWW